MSYSLIVVDLQPYFLKTLDKNVKNGIIDNASLLIKKAMDDKADIFFVEYAPVKEYGVTTKTLTSLTKDYDKVSSVRKQGDDGSEELILALRKNPNFRSKRMKFCGINTDCCVYRTISGYFSAHFYEKTLNTKVIELHAYACGSSYSHEEGIGFISEINNNYSCPYPKIKIIKKAR